MRDEIRINDDKTKYMNVHHLPICTTFYFLNDIPVVDVSTSEEKLSKGRVSVVLNSYGDLCGINSLGALNIGDEDEQGEP